MQPYLIRRVAIDNLAWTPLAAPADIDSFSARCDDGIVRVRTDPADATTEDSLEATVQEVVNAPVRHDRGDFARFRAGAVLIWVRMAAGAGTIVLHTIESRAHPGGI